MATRGAPFDNGPDACPFIALELDRDRRSERPDYRHRCYAEQVPAPRTIAHQERYCLSPNFAGCPIFQDWAVRAAARPVPLPPGYEGRRAAPDPRPDREAAAAAAAAAGAIGGAPGEEWPDSMDVAAPPPALEEPVAAQQLSAFDATPADESTPPPLAADQAGEGDSDHVAAAYAAAGAAALGAEPFDDDPADLPPAPTPPPPGTGMDVEDAAPVPAFLAGRSSRPPIPAEPVKPGRDDVVPSWELTDRYGAQAGGREPSSENTFLRQVLTAIAVVFIVGLGIAAVILIPGLLNGSPGSTPPRSFALASGSPRPTSSALAVLPSSTPATANTPTPVATEAPTPAPTPRLYKIKSGDTMAKIARKFHITVDDILAANPEIPDANHIEVGQFIIIPVALSTT